MNFKPYPHQRAGIDWIIDHPACALLWGMGTGKTVTTLTAVDRLLFDLMEDGPVLVIAPKRVAENTWSKEADKWEHLNHLRVVKIMGTAKQRQEAVLSIFEGPFADVYVINRENIVWLVEYLGKRWPFPIVVIDELSSFKSASAKRWKALRRVRGRIRRIIGLTGTPRPNGLEDLWPEVYLLDQGERLGRTLTAFRSKYLIPEKMNGHVVYSYRAREGAEAEVYDRLADICMSIRKEDVLSLPGQIYEDVVLDAPPALLKQYKQFERDKVMELMPELIDEAREKLSKIKRKRAENYREYAKISNQACAANIIAGLETDPEAQQNWVKQSDDLEAEMQKILKRDEPLRKKDKDPCREIVAGSAAALTNKLLQFANGAIYDMDGQVHNLHTVKLDALEEMLEAAGGDPVLVLYAYQHDADRIRQRITCRALDTPEDIDAWNRGEIPVALAHPASIGHGLNLQDGGHIIIWYGLTWSLELYQQANERLNRPGQRNVCRIYHLVLRGTHDERVLKALANKDKGQAAAIEALRLEILEE